MRGIMAQSAARPGIPRICIGRGWFWAGLQTRPTRQGATQRKLAASSMLPVPVWRATCG